MTLRNKFPSTVGRQALRLLGTESSVNPWGLAQEKPQSEQVLPICNMQKVQELTFKGDL